MNIEQKLDKLESPELAGLDKDVALPVAHYKGCDAESCVLLPHEVVWCADRLRWRCESCASVGSSGWTLEAELKLRGDKLESSEVNALRARGHTDTAIGRMLRRTKQRIGQIKRTPKT